jgi:hypothetical protein
MQVAKSVSWDLVTDSYSCPGDLMPPVAELGMCSLLALLELDSVRLADTTTYERMFQGDGRIPN